MTDRLPGETDGADRRPDAMVGGETAGAASAAELLAIEII